MTPGFQERIVYKLSSIFLAVATALAASGAVAQTQTPLTVAPASSGAVPASSTSPAPSTAPVPAAPAARAVVRQVPDAPMPAALPVSGTASTQASGAMAQGGTAAAAGAQAVSAPAVSAQATGGEAASTSAAGTPQATSPQAAGAPATVQASAAVSAGSSTATREEQFGDITRGLVGLQASGLRSGPGQPLQGAVATAAWGRYMKTFELPIPQWFSERVSGGSGSGSLSQ